MFKKERKLFPLQGPLRLSRPVRDCSLIGIGLHFHLLLSSYLFATRFSSAILEVEINGDTDGQTTYDLGETVRELKKPALIKRRL